MTPNQMTGPVIVTKNLTRTFTTRNHTVEAVRGLDLEIGQGELVAFLGPNGAGKSTTLRMLTTLIPPTSGTASVAGHDVVDEQRQVRRSIGYVGQGNGAGHQQRGRDELVSQGRAHGLSRASARARADELVADLDLSAVADRTVMTLSGGQRRRLDIAMGLVHTPRVLFLDEPSTGLDPQNRANLQSLVQKLHAETGSTIVLTTHYLEEADALAERVIVIDHGSVIADDTAFSLKSRLGDRILLGFTDAEDAGVAAERAGNLAGGVAGAVVRREGAAVELRVTGGHELAPHLIHDLHSRGVVACSMEVSRPTLDDVFLDLTGRSLREASEGAGSPTADDSTTHDEPNNDGPNNNNRPTATEETAA
ncbi:ABC-2 type transport system ATP-binding protein [Nocardioides daedukensis]|uniref:ABC-2 type transport system ATP-binding protein n=1 Tax=Nocardioides daedukensis TaxID=634462 RepID=A0A7Y9S3Z6_9ACTN|nr:ATP-binding cassette domain-containing protein [Nocardioides daedukensis]NYG59678.1 ABC-2 type transport system ATP-binding protein [Nocardioides daedukensis]